MMSGSGFNYDDLRERLQSVLVANVAFLPTTTYKFVAELLDANELGVALETIVEVLIEVNAPVTTSTIKELGVLARDMEMSYDVAAILAPWAVDEGRP